VDGGREQNALNLVSRDGELLIAGPYQELLALLSEAGPEGVDHELYDILRTLVAASQRRSFAPYKTG
jgi:hypothetical protein